MWRAASAAHSVEVFHDEQHQFGLVRWQSITPIQHRFTLLRVQALAGNGRGWNGQKTPRDLGYEWIFTLIVCPPGQRTFRARDVGLWGVRGQLLVQRLDKVDEGKSEVDGDVVVVCKVGSTFTDDGTEAEPASSGLRSTSFAGFVDSCARSISATVAATALWRVDSESKGASLKRGSTAIHTERPTFITLLNITSVDQTHCTVCET